jgi:hypothetical protein
MDTSFRLAMADDDDEDEDEDKRLIFLALVSALLP